MLDRRRQSELNELHERVVHTYGLPHEPAEMVQYKLDAQLADLVETMLRESRRWSREQ